MQSRRRGGSEEKTTMTGETKSLLTTSRAGVCMGGKRRTKGSRVKVRVVGKPEGTEALEKTVKPLDQSQREKKGQYKVKEREYPPDKRGEKAVVVGNEKTINPPKGVGGRKVVRNTEGK